jgi:protein involved in polysaccharide export with SLBB domain
MQHPRLSSISRLILAVTAGLSMVALTGCSATRSSAPSNYDIAAIGPLVAASETEPVAPYHIRRGDLLQIDFHFHPDLDSRTRVRDDGEVTIGGLGEFHALGLTTEELERDIFRRASLTYRSPEVSVVVAEATKERAYVGGEVRRPGYVDVRDGMTSLRAIFERGGFLDTAKVDHVLHVRWDEHGGYDAHVLDLKKVLETGDARWDLALGPNDVVFVPKTAIANADLWVNQYVRQLIPIREPTTQLSDFGLDSGFVP